VDIDAESVKHLGGQIFIDPHDSPTIGKMLLAKDARGAIFWLLKPESVVYELIRNPDHYFAEMTL
jgi:predicted enzyme related to lactoylglutathione lyase